MSMIKKICNVNNLKKTARYLKKNGIRHACYAARERIEEERREQYHYREPSEDLLAAQREETAAYPYLFSIVVPAYETKEAFLREMIDSVRRQSYERWELVIADASSSGIVERIVEEIREATGDARIRYRRLRENRGISENTNAGIAMATGDYIALLDHDDFLTPDALYHMTVALNREARRAAADGYEARQAAADRHGERQYAAAQQRERRNRMPVLLYSDEDKYDDSSRYYTSPHRKTDFNLDLILSNNYICHFMAVEANMLKSLNLRGKYDGAQDYDLVLRVVDRLWRQVSLQEVADCVVHIPRVLYHWRCHAQSTAGNTASKMYAYEAGREAVRDFCNRRGWDVTVEHSLHLGFYEIDYRPDLLQVRPEVGIVGGRLSDRHHRICGGVYSADGVCFYDGLHREYSGGSTHRAVLKQDAAAVDIRCMQVCPALQGVFEEITGLPYRERKIRCKTRNGRREQSIADVTGISCDEAGYRKLSMALGRAARELGYLVVWDPTITCDMK